jgi:hypothetical protein
MENLLYLLECHILHVQHILLARFAQQVCSRRSCSSFIKLVGGGGGWWETLLLLLL